MILKNAQTNWKFLLIVAVFAGFAGIGILEFSTWQPVPQVLPFTLKKAKFNQSKVVDGLVLIQNLDKKMIMKKVREGKKFLEQMEDKNYYGFHKYYYAEEDRFEARLHSVYSASIVYTFLYYYDLTKDKGILNRLSDWGDFLIFMQDKNKEDKSFGAFHYSFFLEHKKKEKKFPVGTSALNIFTLLRLYDLTQETRYLESARLAGDWLVTMQNPDGTMKPYMRYSDGKWVYGKKESLLYEGQVLSALSKLYQATNDERYYNSAKKIAQHFAKKYEKENGYIQGEYRKKNPISNSWVVMSLMDFYKVEKDASERARYQDIIFELSGKILANQRDDPDDLFSYGSWAGTYSTSGTGWISEVMAQTYLFCKQQSRGDCDKYKQAVIKAIRWLIQHTYSKENAFLVKNPERATGGIFWNKSNKYVRTDSVCHALNSYILIINDLEDKLLLSVPTGP